jgi:hypothetical protein
MNDMNYMSIKIKCSQCNNIKTEQEAVNLPQFDAKKIYTCNHYDIILMKTYDKNFRVKIVFICNRCSKIKNIDLNLGKINPNRNLITNDSSSFNCCGGYIQLNSYLLKNQNDLLYNNDNNINFNVNNNIINNDVGFNDIYLDENNNIHLEDILRSEKENFEKKNIVEFDKKNKVLYFKDARSNKSYKIYSKSDLKIKDVLSDLENQFPELNLQNKKLKVGNTQLDKDLYLNSYNLNDNNIILI